MNLPKITVLMSTYNGEDYLREQIDSILSQINVDLYLLVRDDGSKDNTVQILDGYKQKGALDYYVGENIGWKLSFMHLLQNAPDSDFYAFSDQDDHWLPDKLSVAIEKIKGLTDGPQLYVSNTYYWKDEIKVLTNKIKPDVNAARCLIWCLGPGCTMVFNKELKSIIKEHPIHDSSIPHDYWVQSTAFLFGSIYYDMDSHILYRQHGNNQLGATITTKEIYKLRFKQFRNLRSNRVYENRVKQLLNCYGNSISGEKKELCKKIAFYRLNIKNYFRLLWTCQFNNESIATTIGFKLRVLLCHL